MKLNRYEGYRNYNPMKFLILDILKFFDAEIIKLEKMIYNSL